VNRHLDTFRIAEGAARRRLEQELEQVEEELRNVERAILAGIVSETTTALVQDRETRRRALKERLAAMDARRGIGPLPVDAATITNTVVYTGTHGNPTTRLKPRRYPIKEQQRMKMAGCSKRSRRLESGSDEKQATAVPVGRGDQQPSDRGRKRAQ